MYDNATHTPRWNQPFTGHQMPWRELYDHRGDTGDNWALFESANVVGHTAYAALVANLSAILHKGPNLLAPTL